MNSSLLINFANHFLLSLLFSLTIRPRIIKLTPTCKYLLFEFIQQERIYVILSWMRYNGYSQEAKPHAFVKIERCLPRTLIGRVPADSRQPHIDLGCFRPIFCRKPLQPIRTCFETVKIVIKRIVFLHFIRCR